MGKYDELHTCHNECERPACVLRRKVAALEAELAAMKALADRLAEENKALRHWSVGHIDALLLYAAGTYPKDSHVRDAVAFCRIVAPGKKLRMDPLEASSFHPARQALTEWRDQ